MKSHIPTFEHRPPAEFDVNDSSIHLRLFRHGDEENLVRLVDDEPVQRFVPWAKRIIDKTTAEKAIDEFESLWERGVIARYVVEQDGKFAGYAGLWSDRNQGYYEFGFAVLPEFRGQGIGTKTTKELSPS